MQDSVSQPYLEPTAFMILLSLQKLSLIQQIFKEIATLFFFPKFKGGSSWPTESHPFILNVQVDKIIEAPKSLLSNTYYMYWNYIRSLDFWRLLECSCYHTIRFLTVRWGCGRDLRRMENFANLLKLHISLSIIIPDPNW